ncbi:hypothetical protein BH20ACT23_BH20ACT23_15050 [soil metagenome]
MSESISVHLDPEALRALAQLETMGMTKSEAIGRALIRMAAEQRHDRSLAVEVAALGADEADRREIQRVAELMRELRASW